MRQSRGGSQVPPWTPGIQSCRKVLEGSIGHTHQGRNLAWNRIAITNEIEQMRERNSCLREDTEFVVGLLLQQPSLPLINISTLFLPTELGSYSSRDNSTCGLHPLSFIHYLREYSRKPYARCYCCPTHSSPHFQGGGQPEVLGC